MASPAPTTPAMFDGATMLSKNKDLANVNDTITTMKASLADLGQLFDSLGQRTSRAAQSNEESETTKHLNKVRKEMDESDRRHQEQVDQIQAMIGNILEHEVITQLRDLIKTGVIEQIDDAVEKEVAVELARLRPQAMQSEVHKHRKELELVQKELHNSYVQSVSVRAAADALERDSESRRLNALLRTNKIVEELHTLYRSDGIVSPAFPKTLQALISLDGDTAKQLMKEYEIEEVSDSRERNVNRFMQFVGVVYQLKLFRDICRNRSVRREQRVNLTESPSAWS
ncbi:hypothetical protein NM688_g2662 [Phlebia brevispora]|uniref:Uncharacterized protein n=1 Tax=Phlebia brevispora TaxID=194682 RepID=A0ACC1T7Q1_9APHY|nr:hypothetical protein NM688_g2662 [Phlebia brevispora]